VSSRLCRSALGTAPTTWSTIRRPVHLGQSRLSSNPWGTSAIESLVPTSPRLTVGTALGLTVDLPSRPSPGWRPRKSCCATVPSTRCMPPSPEVPGEVLHSLPVGRRAGRLPCSAANRVDQPVVQRFRSIEVPSSAHVVRDRVYRPPGGAREMRLEPHEQVPMLAPPGVDAVGRSEEPPGRLSEPKPRMRRGRAVTGRGSASSRRCWTRSSPSRNRNHSVRLRLPPGASAVRNLGGRASCGSPWSSL
jgi:hypothetical protein